MSSIPYEIDLEPIQQLASGGVIESFGSVGCDPPVLVDTIRQSGGFTFSGGGAISEDPAKSGETGDELMLVGDAKAKSEERTFDTAESVDHMVRIFALPVLNFCLPLPPAAFVFFCVAHLPLLSFYSFLCPGCKDRCVQESHGCAHHTQYIRAASMYDFCVRFPCIHLISKNATFCTISPPMPSPCNLSRQSPRRCDPSAQESASRPV